MKIATLIFVILLSVFSISASQRVVLVEESSASN